MNESGNASSQDVITNDTQKLTYAVDFFHGRKRRSEPDRSNQAPLTISRLARLVALAIRFDGLIRAGQMRNYAEIAQLGHVTRGRLTQIMKLRLLAPDIQGELLFQPEVKGVNERNLRDIARRVDWEEQRRLFERMQLANLDQRRGEEIPNNA